MKLLKLLFLCFCVACGTQKQVSNDKDKNVNMKQPTLVYKTKQNYDNLVPVLLSDDKTEIVMYPAPTDIYYQGQLALPTKLEQGYLLDNRGIGNNVAFLKLTYQEYAKLEKVPLLTELYKMIVDKDPLLELYECGGRQDFTNIISQLNKAIKNGKLSDYTKVK